MTTPGSVIRPIGLLSKRSSVNQRLPSGPAAIPRGMLAGPIPGENSVITPPGVMRPMRLPANSVNQRVPSGPAVIPSGCPLAGNSFAVARTGAIRPIRLGASSVNQRPPSGPGVISAGRLLAEMPEPVEKSVILPWMA